MVLWKGGDLANATSHTARPIRLSFTLVASRSLCLSVVFALIATSPAAHAGSFFDNVSQEVGSCFSGGCDVVWELNKRFDNGVRSKSDALVGPAKAAFDDSMKTLFAERIAPLLSTVNAMAAARIDQTAAAMNGLIARAGQGIDQIIEHAADVASKAVGDIRRQIIDVAFADASQLLNQLKEGALQVIDRADCAILGNIEQTRLAVGQAISWMPHPFDSCYRSQGFALSTPKADDYLSIYRIRQCQISQELAPTKTVGQLRDTYVKLALWSANMRCVMRHSGVAVDLIESDILTYTKSYKLWTEVVK